MSGAPPRIALIHALAHSIAPVNAELDRVWPGCVRMNLVDDSLAADLAANPAGLDDAMTARFIALAGYVVGTGVRGILFTCSAFGPCGRTRPSLLPIAHGGSMSKRFVALLAAVALFAAAGTLLAQQPAPAASNIKRTPLQKVDIPGTSYETVTAIAEVAPGANAGRHTHPGPETGYVIEGDMSARRATKPNDSLQRNARGKPRRARRSYRRVRSRPSARCWRSAPSPAPRSATSA